MSATAPSRGALAAFAALSFAFYAHSGLIVTYAPLWYQSLGYGTLAIAVLVSLQGATRLFMPYAWGWLADHSGRRVGMLRLAVGVALASALAYGVSSAYAWVFGATLVMFIATSGVTPMTEAALSQVVTRAGGAGMDVGRYGRVRLWGSIGFIAMVAGGGALLQSVGIGAYPALVVTLLAVLLAVALRLPALDEPPHGATAAGGVLAVLREPPVGWFFAGMFFTVLAHAALYGFFSLFLVSLGYSKTAVGLLWAIGVIVEVVWFWFQGRLFERLTPHGWLTLAAAATMLRFPLTAVGAGVPWFLAALQCSHAVTFAVQHSACIAVINRHFPGRLRARGQALYTVIGYGASGVIGALAGGALSQAAGYRAVFWAGGVAGAAAVACSLRAAAIDRRAAAAAS